MNVPAPERRFGGLTDDLLLAAIYVCATTLTNAWFMGDTLMYVQGTLASTSRASLRDSSFWEFGHLFWRPFGWLWFSATGFFTRLVVGADAQTQMTLALMGLNWLTGLGCLFVLRALAVRLGAPRWVGNTVALGFLFTQGFLDYTQTGCSYVPGLLLLLLGYYFLARDEAASRRYALNVTWAALCLAGAICLWLPYVFVLPGILLFPLLWFGFSRRRLWLALHTGVAITLLVGIAYLVVMLALGITSRAALIGWVTAASHGYHQTGVARMLFGLARSFIHLGNDGLLLKRFMLHDPYNPVSLFGLLQLSLWKLVLFYLFLAAFVLALLRAPRGRSLGILLLIHLLPILALALILFEGGSSERYLPLFPIFFLALAYIFSESRARVVRAFALAFLIIAGVVNVAAMNVFKLRRQETQAAGRIRDLQPRLNARSTIAVFTPQDELANFYYTFLFNPLNRQGTLYVYDVIDPGVAQTVNWRQGFARKALETWARGGDMWLSTRLFAAQPKAEWVWAEGNEPTVAWRDLPNFFRPLETGETVGGEDGFVLLLPSARNRESLNGYATAQRGAR